MISKLGHNGIFGKMEHRILLSAVMSLAFISPVLTSPAMAEPLRGETFCFPAEQAAKIVNNLKKVKADRRDIVDVGLEPRFIIKDGGDWPQRFYLRKDEAVVTDLPFSREDGAVPDFMGAIQARPDTDICVDDPTRADRPQYDEGLYFEMGLAPIFHNQSGEHSMAELAEGAKDGKRFYKRMIPSVFRPFMPDTDYMAVKYQNVDTAPAIFAQTATGDIALTPEAHKELWVVSLDDMEALDAQALIVRGGAYELQPVPSPKTMRKFGWGQKEE